MGYLGDIFQTKYSLSVVIKIECYLAFGKFFIGRERKWFTILARVDHSSVKLCRLASMLKYWTLQMPMNQSLSFPKVNILEITNQ